MVPSFVHVSASYPASSASSRCAVASGASSGSILPAGNSSITRPIGYRNWRSSTRQPSGSTGTISTAPGWTTYSRVASPPSGNRTRSQRTCSSLPSHTASDESLVSISPASPVGVIEPVLCDEKIRVEPRLRRARLGLPVVAPPRERRHRHQGGLGAPARLEAEQRTAIPHEVELDIASAAIELEIALTLAVRRR